MSFKYRFIFSFVLLEIFFILLIVTMNFITINNSSEKLIQQKIESSISFFDKMAHVPISIYDLASLDDLTKETTELGYINSIIVLDNQNRVLSKSYQFKHISEKELLLSQDNQIIQNLDTTYEIRYQKINNNDTELGAFYIIFDTSENSRFITENKKNTAYLILIEILISTILSYIIGNRLTNALTKLSEVAVDIGNNKDTKIPFQDRTDEFGILATSMNQMQIDLKQRNVRLKNFTRDLSKQKKELISANKSKDDFLANMSHELKTPLNSINVISSIMMKNTKKSLNEEQVKNLSIINNCGNDLLFLINDVLDVAKLEAGEIQLVNETLDFKVIMDNIYEMFNPQMEIKNIEFIYQYNNNIGFIYSDEQRIKQVVKNLLSNAVKFAQNGTVKLLVSDNQDTIKVVVEDNGIGIAQNKLEHIFDRFKQVDESTTRNYGGTGLGLAICKELTHLLGGEIFVESEENKGTSFTITIAKSSEQINNVELKKEDIKSIPKEIITDESLVTNYSHDILILNNDPISFFKLVIELKKEHTVIQSNNTIDFLEDYKKNKKINLAIIDASVIDRSNLEKIINKLPIQFILIYSMRLDIFDNEKIIHRIKKPFNFEDILRRLTTKKE
jgi:signal transduction histidine kinase